MSTQIEKTYESDHEYFDEEPQAPEGSELAYTMQTVFDLLLTACKYNEKRIVIAIARISGLSYSEIGARFNMSKEGVRKHLDNIGSVNPMLSKYLRTQSKKEIGTAEGFKRSSFLKAYRTKRKEARKA